MLTIGGLLKNLSKGQSAVPTKLIFSQLNSVYQSLKPKIRILKAQEKAGGILVYLYIPSQSNPKLYYDVDIWFKSKDRITQSTEFKIYSNSPAFGYSYAYLFHKNGALLFPEKYPSIMLREAPKVRNPFETVSFDKHVYSALAFIFNQNLAALVQMSSNDSVNVETFLQKMEEAKTKGEKENKKITDTSPFRGR